MPDDNKHQMPHTDQTAQVPPLDAQFDKESRFADLRQWWTAAWTDGGVLYERWEELRLAPELGWHAMANWIKTALGLAGICAAIILVTAASSIVGDTLDRLLTAAPTVKVGVDTTGGVRGVIDSPVRSYIATHSASLAISGSTVYTVWQLVGLFGLVGGFCRSTGARLTWTAWGAASIAMVWSNTPAPGRQDAAGIAVLAWQPCPAWRCAACVSLRSPSSTPTTRHPPPLRWRSARRSTCRGFTRRGAARRPPRGRPRRAAKLRTRSGSRRPWRCSRGIRDPAASPGPGASRR